MGCPLLASCQVVGWRRSGVIWSRRLSRDRWCAQWKSRVGVAEIQMIGERCLSLFRASRIRELKWGRLSAFSLGAWTVTVPDMCPTKLVLAASTRRKRHWYPMWRSRHVAESSGLPQTLKCGASPVR